MLDKMLQRFQPEPGEVMEDEAAFTAAMGVAPLFEEAQDIPREEPNPLMDAQAHLSYDPDAGMEDMEQPMYDDEAMKQALLGEQAELADRSEQFQSGVRQENEAEQQQRGSLLEGDDYAGA